MPGITWTNEMNFVLNHAPGAGSIAQSVEQQPSALPLSNGCPRLSPVNASIKLLHIN